MHAVITKRQILFLILMVFSIKSTSAQEVQNPGFEFYDTSYNTGLSNWTAITREYSIEMDSIEVFNGKYSIRIASNEAENYGLFEQKIPFKSSELKKYKFSGYIKVDSVTGGFVGLMVRVYSNEYMSFLGKMDDQILRGTKDWNPYSVDFIVDEYTTMVILQGILVGKGKAWFDDFSLKSLGIEKRSISDTAEKYINEVLSIIKKHSIKKDSIGFEKLQNTCLTISSGAINTSDCYTAIKYALGKLKDNHSMLRTPQQVKEWKSTSSKEVKKILPMADGEILHNLYAYVDMPGFGSGDSLSCILFADSLQTLIENLDKKAPKAWILDLRRNLGGNCWPMLAGIGPLLGEGIAGYFVDIEGNKVGWYYKNGASGDEEYKIGTHISRRPYYLKKDVPIAVLIGPKTTSSGEIVAISFIGKPNTKLFGEPTCGLSTGNENFELSDGALLFLTTVIDADRNNMLYGGKINPDVYIGFSNKDYDKNNDPVINATINWFEEIVK